MTKKEGQINSGMKRTCHGNNIQGGGTKGHVNLVEKAILWHGVPHVRI
jgi:hypothetical protein